MRPTDFDIFANILKDKSGLSLTADKTYLLESRLNPVAKEFGFDDLQGLAMKLSGFPDPKLVTAIVEAMTTNETSFFRDTRPFDLLKETLLPYMKGARATQKRLRIWCAAASSGQEPYTIAMILKEAAAEFPGWSFDITATDISHDVLDIARAGAYSQFEVQRGLPIQLLMKYFTQRDDQKWEISDDIKKMVNYKYFNLLEPMTAMGTFDIIFCRNVLIYFDEKTKGEVLDKMTQRIENDSFIMLGGAETVIGITDNLKPMPNKRGIYVKPDSVHTQADTPPIAAATPAA